MKKLMFVVLLGSTLCSCYAKHMYCESTSEFIIKDIVVLAMEIEVNDYPEGGICVDVEED